jgi:hypothetical protein
MLRKITRGIRGVDLSAIGEKYGSGARSWANVNSPRAAASTNTTTSAAHRTGFLNVPLTFGPLKVAGRAGRSPAHSHHCAPTTDG